MLTSIPIRNSRRTFSCQEDAGISCKFFGSNGLGHMKSAHNGHKIVSGDTNSIYLGQEHTVKNTREREKEMGQAMQDA